MPKVFLTEKPIDSLALNPPARSADVHGSRNRFVWAAKWYGLNIRLPPIRLPPRFSCERSLNCTLTGLLNWEFFELQFEGLCDVTMSVGEGGILAMGAG